MSVSKCSTHTASTRLLLEVLLEAGLVGELPEAVGALERHALAAAAAAGAAVRRLHVVVEEALLGEVLQGELMEKCHHFFGGPLRRKPATFSFLSPLVTCDG